MDFDTLNQLIEMPKKAEASKAKKKLYVEQMSILLSEEGVSSSSIKYLKSGFTFAGAKPVAIYLQKLQTEQRITELSKLMASDLFRGGDKLFAFRFGMSLSAYSIEWFGEDQQILLSLIKVLPFVSKNKEMQLLKDAPKIFEKHFLDVVSDSTPLPCIDVSGLKEIHIREYRQMMFDIIGKVSSDYRTRAARIGDWIGCGSDVVTVLTRPLDEKKNDNDSDKQIEVINSNSSDVKEISSVDEGSLKPECSSVECKSVMDEPVVKIVPYTQKELADAITLLGEFSVRFEATIAEWSAAQRELDVAKAHIAETQRMLQRAEVHLSIEKKQKEDAIAELNNRSLLMAELNLQFREAKKTVEKLEAKIAEMNNENTRLNAILSVYSSDKQNTQSEQLNAIASKLKPEYRDFKEVENEEMSIDLGENFRFQIQSIFKILAKAGIDVERR